MSLKKSKIQSIGFDDGKSSADVSIAFNDEAVANRFKSLKTRSSSV